MANESGGIIAIVKDPGVRHKVYIHLVPHLQLQTHTTGYCLKASCTSMVACNSDTFAILHQSQ